MADASQTSLTKFQPLGSYAGLDTGPNWIANTLSAESSAVDGTLQRLRSSRLGSPFTFRIVPPDILLDALLGRGQAQTSGAFDGPLRLAFEDAQRNLDTVLADPTSSPAEIEEARQALLGTRPPITGDQNIEIIDTALRASNNFSKVTERRRQFRQSNFFASGPTRGATLSRLDKMIAANGIQFDPLAVEQSQANQAAVSDLIQALDVIVQVNRIAVTPALTLLVNPQNLTITYAKKQVYQDRNRYNYVFQSWGEEQVRMSVSGRSAGFVAGSRGTARQASTAHGVVPFETVGVSGYQYASKWSSAAWQNLMGLFTFYRNNGYIYDTAGRPRSEAHLFIGHVEITYDQFVYLGQFENFQYSYDEGRQHGAVDFSFEFTVSFMFDRSQSGAVRPYVSPPMPSPSSVQRGQVPFVPNQEANAMRTINPFVSSAVDPFAPSAAPSTAVLDPLVDPRTFNGPTAVPSPGSQAVNPFAPTTLNPF